MLNPAMALARMDALGVRAMNDPHDDEYRWWLTNGGYLQGAYLLSSLRGPVTDYGPASLLVGALRSVDGATTE